MTTSEDVLRDLGADPARISDLVRVIDDLIEHPKPLDITREEAFELGFWYVWILYMRSLTLSRSSGTKDPPYSSYKYLADYLNKMGLEKVPGDLLLFTRERQLLKSLFNEVSRIFPLSMRGDLTGLHYLLLRIGC